EQVLMTDLQSDSQTFFAAVNDLQTYRRAQADAASKAANDVSNSARLWIMLALGSLAVFCILTGWMLAVSIARPISRMTQAMLKLADNDTSVSIPGQGRKDEIGGMAAALTVFRENMQQADALRNRQGEVEA